MSEYFTKIFWVRRDNEKYIDNQYSRGHEWHFDGGATVIASSSPHVVPLPYSVEANVDPEEAFVASLYSCHMLFFLSIAAKRRYVTDKYVDNAVGTIEKDNDGKISMTKVTLRPQVEFSGERQPTFEQLEKMHHQSHKQCFIANSVKTEVVINEPNHMLRLALTKEKQYRPPDEWHWGHSMVIWVPHSSQYLTPFRFSDWHEKHFMNHLPDFGC